MFAGGAVIAEQIDNPYTADAVVWTHADPVTGSSVEVLKSGESFDSLRKELEPLGQVVQPVEPEQTGGASVISSENHSASSPEWLCPASGEYLNVPVSCQEMMRESRNDEQLRKIVASSKTEKNPLKITMQDSPMPEMYSPSDETRSYALTSSDKKDKDKKKKKERPTLKRPDKNAPRPVVNEEDLEQPIQGGGMLDVFGYALLASSLSDELTTRAIVDQTVLVTGKGGEVEGDAQIQAIKNQVRRLVTDNNCRKAFIDNGFGDPRKLLLNSIENKVSGDSSSFKYTIVSAFALRDDGVAQQLGIGKQDRQDVLNSTASGSTITPLGLTFIRNGAFRDNYTIEEIITHEFIHGLGYPKGYYVGRAEGLIKGFHDLRYLGKKYNEVIDACAK